MGLKDASAAVNAATERLSAVQDEMDKMDVQQQTKEDDRNKGNALFEDFKTLKKCEYENSAEQKKTEKNTLGPLTSLLDQIGADKSLISAIPSALAKKPEERGSFDNMVV